MVFLPFLFFTGLTLYWWHKHKRLDICIYMSALWALTSLLSVVIVMMNIADGSGILWSGWDVELNFVPTVAYCVFVGVTLFPFSMLYGRDLKQVNNNAPWALMIVSWLLIFVALLNLYLVADSTLDILQGNFAELRNEHYSGDMSPADIKAESLPYPLGYFRYLNYSTILALPIFFYYICFEKKPWWFTTLLFFAALTSPIAGLQQADRTEIIFVAEMFVLCVVFFIPFMSKKVKVTLGVVTSLLATIVIAYVAAVSIARFEDREEGAGGSVLKYAGQGYLNYAYFFEKANYDEIYTEREFPLINHVLFGIDSNADRRAERSAKQGFYISVFPTYIGELMLDLSPFGAIIWIMLQSAFCILFIKRPFREEIDVGELLGIMTFAAIPVFGIFYYRYFHFLHVQQFFLVLYVWIMSKYSIKL